MRLHSNYKAATPEGWVAEIKSHNLLVGPNGSHKSSIHEALELVLAGQVSDILGRDAVKAPAMLWRAKPDKAKTLFAMLTTDAGVVYRWEQKTKAARPTWTMDSEPFEGAAVRFPVAQMRKHLYASEAKATAWISERIGITTTRVLEEVVKLLDAADCGERTRAVLATTPSMADENGVALTPPAVLAVLRKRKRDATADAKAATRVAETIAENLGTPPTEEELASARATASAANAALSNARNEDATIARWLSLASEMAETHATVTAMPETPDADSWVKARDAVKAIMGALDAVATTWPGTAECPCCKTGVGVEHLATRRAALADYAMQADNVLLTHTQRGTAVERLRVLNQEIRTTIDGLAPETVAAVQAGTWVSAVAQMTTASEAARTTLMALEARAVQGAEPTLAAGQADTAEARAAALDEATKVFKKGLSIVVDSRLDDLAAAAQPYVPKKFGKVKLALYPNVEIGYAKGKAISIPSGGEEAVLLAALALGVIDLTAATASVQEQRIIVIEDRAMDRTTFKHLTTMLPKAPGIVFLSTVNGMKSAPDGWTLLDKHAVVKYEAPADPPADLLVPAPTEPVTPMIADPPAAPPALAVVPEAQTSDDGTNGGDPGDLAGMLASVNTLLAEVEGIDVDSAGQQDPE